MRKSVFPRGLLPLVFVALVLFSPNSKGETNKPTHAVRVVKREGNRNLVETVTSFRKPDGKLGWSTNRYVQLQSGLNYMDAAGQWRPTAARFEITPDGVEAVHSPHKVKLAANINTAGAVEVITSDNVHLKSHPIGIGFYDPVTGASVLLAETRDSVAQLVGENIVLYPDAFTDINASIRYVLTTAGIEQDILIHGALPWTPADFKMSDKARLEVYTEFLPETSEPVKKNRILTKELNAAARAKMFEPDFEDETLFYSREMRIGPGRAFSFEEERTNNRRNIPVAKRLEVIEGRKILFEAIEYKKGGKDTEKS